MTDTEARGSHTQAASHPRRAIVRGRPGLHGESSCRPHPLLLLTLSVAVGAALTAACTRLPRVHEVQRAPASRREQVRLEGPGECLRADSAARGTLRAGTLAQSSAAWRALPALTSTTWRPLTREGAESALLGAQCLLVADDHAVYHARRALPGLLRWIAMSRAHPLGRTRLILEAMPATGAVVTCEGADPELQMRAIASYWPWPVEGYATALGTAKQLGIEVQGVGAGKRPASSAVQALPDAERWPVDMFADAEELEGEFHAVDAAVLKAIADQLARGENARCIVVVGFQHIFGESGLCARLKASGVDTLIVLIGFGEVDPRWRPEHAAALGSYLRSGDIVLPPLRCVPGGQIHVSW